MTAPAIIDKRLQYIHMRHKPASLRDERGIISNEAWIEALLHSPTAAPSLALTTVCVAEAAEMINFPP